MRPWEPARRSECDRWGVTLARFLIGRAVPVLSAPYRLEVEGENPNVGHRKPHALGTNPLLQDVTTANSSRLDYGPAVGSSM